jgi:hypothetical protein
MRLRFSLRWLVLVVALAALLMFGEQMRRNRNSRLRKASEFDGERQLLIVGIKRLEKSAARIRGLTPTQAEIMRQVNEMLLDDLERDMHLDHIREDYFHRMAEWYKQRAARPWERLGEEPRRPREIE